MTVANNYAPVVTAANGVTTVFSGSWNAIGAANLVVQLLNTTTGIFTTVTQGVASNQYQVTTLTATGFVITFNTAPATGNNVIISRLTPAAQPVPYTTSRGFQGSVEENSFDALTAMIQENNYNNTKAISAPVGDVATNLILPIASIRAGYVLAFDSSGNVIVSTQTLAQIQSPGTSAAAAAASATASATSATASAASATASAGSATAAAASAAAAAASAAPWAVATGTGDAIVCAFSPAITSLTDGLLVAARVPGANTLTNPTLKANATTAHTITKEGGAALFPSDIPGNLAECIFRYNLANTRWELLNPGISGLTPLSTQVVSSQASVSFTNQINGTFSSYVIECIDVTLSSAGATLNTTVSEDAGSTYKNTGYYNQNSYSNNTPIDTASNNASNFTLGGPTSASAGAALAGTIKFWNPAGTSVWKNFLGNFSMAGTSNPAQNRASFCGTYQGDTNAINAVKLAPSSGTLSGTFKLYGIP